MYKLKQYLRQPRRGVRFTTANPRELRTVDDDGNEHPFREESYEALEHFLPFLNHLQNEHGPMQKGHIDARNYTRDDFEAFMGNFPGEYIEYDQTIAWENYKRNGRQYEERHPQNPPVSSSSRQQSDNSSTGSAPSNEDDLTAGEKLELRAKMDYFNMYFKIRRPMNDYSFMLEKDDQFPEYNHHLITTAKAHGTWFLLNLDKNPMDVCLHEAVYSMPMPTCILCSPRPSRLRRASSVLRIMLTTQELSILRSLNTTLAILRMPRCLPEGSMKTSCSSVYHPRVIESWLSPSTSHSSRIASSHTTIMWIQAKGSRGRI